MKKTSVLMLYRNRHIQTLTIILTALLAGGSSAVRAGVVVKGSVYGGGNEGEVQNNSVVIIESGTIWQNVFGGGNNADVLKNDTVTMSAGTVQGNIYGGGNLGDVGTIDKSNLRSYKWADKPYPAADNYTYNNTGVCIVSITGGTVGIEGALSDEHGNVFGGGKGSAYDFWCEKGMVYRTSVSIGHGTVRGNIYGGGEVGRVETNTAVTIGPEAENADSIPDIKGSIFGAGKGKETHGYSALVRGNTDVIVRNGSKVGQNVYGGGEIASVGKYNVDSNGMPYSLANNGSGICRVYIPGSTQIEGDIFGGGKGFIPVDYETANPKPGRMDGSSQWETFSSEEAYLVYLQTLALATQTEVTIDPGATGSVIQSTKGSVYGGSENGIVQHSTLVTVQGNCQIGEGAGKGNIYGGGKGLEGNEGAGQVSGDAVVNINNGIIIGSVYGGGVLGATKGNVTVNINGGTVKQDVYGGGALAHTNTSNWSTYVEVTDVPADPKTAGLYEMSFGGIYTFTADETAVEDKTYYRKMATPSWANSTQKSAVNKTRVNLLGGTIEGGAYGGALGDDTHEPFVYGDILVDLNGTTTSGTTGTVKNPAQKGCVVPHVFGCNNAKGTPKGNVLVHVYATQNSAAAHIANQEGDTEAATKPKVKGRYDVEAVYGGGNQAAYNPVDPTTNKTQVVIDGCDYTSIDSVYGGGNAAPVPSTDVTVNSCYEIKTLFGGGNGSGYMDPPTNSVPNPGADVGIIDQTAYATDKTTGIYGLGTALVKLLGGEIEVVYGGSNERGNIVGGATVNVSEEGDCALKVGQIYGAGNNAEMDGGTDIVMGCMPEGVIEEIYAGARNADVAGDVKLTITSGTFGRVFGGNKHGGKLQGSITVNIEETGNCEQPIVIGELYGGGNLADYSVYGYNATTGEANETGIKRYADPRLNVHAFTSIGAIYGGGYRAKMVANPTVDINVVKGSHTATAYPAGTIADIPLQKKDGSGNIVDDGTITLNYPAHEANKIGAINNVFGGGNLAPIVGNATVNIGTETKTYFKTEPTHLRTDAEIPLTPVAEGTNAGLYETTVEGAIILGSVYGGGNEANITGNTQVNICAKYDETAAEYRRVVPGTAGVTIAKDVFGAGKGINTDATTALVTGNTTIVMMDGEVKQSVYGGGELSQVGGNTTISVSGGVIGTRKDGDTVFGGETYGNVYGGGKGNKDSNDGAITDATLVAAGLIKGNTTINISNIVATAGNAEYYGVTEGSIVSTPEILHNVYGGGAYGSVGTFAYDASNTITALSSGGKATLTITGGTIGTDGHENGMIFGSSRGDVGAPDAIHDKLAWVYDTEVVIGTANAKTGPAIKGSIYGSGENGHTYRNASVAIHSGTVGITDTEIDGGAAYAYRGNVYGAGCGTDKYEDNGNRYYNAKSGIVGGDVTLLIDGGQVVRHVYGGGAMGSVTGSTTVTIGGTAVIGVDGNDNGNVYAASRGELTDPDKATVGATVLNISGGEIKGNAFGGGQAGMVKGNVAVNVTGGRVVNDVYGGGALAHTNLDNWNASTQALATTYNTTLSLTGGVIGNVYGGGLGNTETEANVYGDVSLTVNGTAFTAENDTYTEYWYKSGDEYVKRTESGTVPKTGRVFGCNNIKGTPKGNVSVVIRQTKRYDAIERQVVEGHEVNKYEIRGVYGGGNLANYVPVKGRHTSVDVHDCANTSIEKVYGGGNSANVPTTHVTIWGCFDIHYVFGGGNGADVIWRNNRWEENDGANVIGDASVVLKGGTISDAFIGSDTKGSVQNATANVTTESGGECALKLTNFYGSSKRADVFGDVNIKISACSDDNIENVYGGSYDAQIYGNITMTVTSGILKNVLGGNDRLGSIGGNITINIDEADDCKPIIIQNLYGGGFNAPYPGAGAKRITNAKDADGYYIGDGVTRDKETGAYTGLTYENVESGNITINIKSCTRIDNIYGGGLGTNAVVTGNTQVNVNMVKGSFANKDLPDLSAYTGQTPPNVENGKIKDDIGTIGNIFGGGEEGNVRGNATINIGTATETTHLVLQHDGSGNPVTDGKNFVYNETPGTVLGAHITGNIYGGGKVADVTGNTKVYICTADSTTRVPAGASGVSIAGNVFGGGQGNQLLFTCEKAMVGHDGDGYNLEKGNTAVVIGDGTIGGSVFGGGEIGRVENNTSVTIGLGNGGSGTKQPVITGNVFGAGQGTKTHGYSALVRGKSTVTIGGDAWVQGSVYGGGDMSSVGRFWVKGTPGADDAPEHLPAGMPYKLKDTDPAHESGKCVVTIQNHAEIGPDNMTMPTFSGHVFGAGKGALPEYHSYTGTDIPERMQMGNTWDYFEDEAAYITFIETLGMSAETDVTIKDDAFVKGSVYGGSENGHVLHDTYVKIQGGQIGNGWNPTLNAGAGGGINRRYTADEWAYDVTTNASHFLYECNHWAYGENIGTAENPKWVHLPYDLYNLDSESKPKAASDGHTFYGNVFGGGSGYFPYRRTYAALDGANAWVRDAAKSTEVGMPVDAYGYSDGKWLRSAGTVNGNTRVDITGGHILTSVYGGNEQTDVGTYPNNSLTPEAGTGTCTINMTGGTLGVPRTLQQIHDHPVTCYLFGAGKGDQRINFNTWTNVGNTEVNISGNALIYGSTFGGGEDGHVMGNAVTTIGTITVDGATVTESGDGVRIGTWGSSYVDGNVFGGGRGFSGDALTAGTVGGNVTVNINGGKMLGSIYGGGRLASVGTYFENPTLPNGDPDPLYGQFKEDTGSNTYGHITVIISGGTIGNGTAGTAADLAAGYSDMKYSGNVFGGCMGRLTLLDNTMNPLWPELAQAKTSIVNINGSAHITRNVYGGAEYGTVRENAWVTIGGSRTTTGSFDTEGTITADASAPTIDGSVYGGGFGSDDHEHMTTIAVQWNEQAMKFTYTPMQWAGNVGGDTYVNLLGGQVKECVYGGGQLASVGIINYNVDSTTPVGMTTSGTPSYTQLTKHDGTNYIVDAGTANEKIYGFALSWPYAFTYVSCTPDMEHPRIGGKATVNIKGGQVGTGTNEGENGYVYGGGKGQVSFGATDAIAEQRYTEAFCANVRETSVTIGDGTSTPQIRTVYGGGEDGHVYTDTHVTINSGTVDRTVFGGGKGTSPFTTNLWNTASPGTPKSTTDDVHSWTAGKVYGNTNVTMNAGSVGWFIYGGGNLASVGKGNYSGGSDDYSTAGYGELPPIGNQALWTNTDFTNSGQSTVTILGGRVGPELPTPVEDSKVDTYINADGIPYGSVFGGSRGQAAKSVSQSPRYRYMPDFFLGYVNKAVINIGGTTADGPTSGTGPTIVGSVYGGGQDGHVRNGTEVRIFKGNITGQGAYESAARSGHVFGAGSGIGRYTDGANTYLNSSSGSVTCTTLVEVSGNPATTTIAGNIYGGGALASVGPRQTEDFNEYHAPSGNHKSCSYTLVNIKGGAIGGSVYGASRGPSEAFLASTFNGVEEAGNSAADEYNPTKFATDIWSDVNISGGTIAGNVYGGGEGGRVKESATVILSGGVVGTASAGGDVYGGGKGTKHLAAHVGGNTTVELNRGKTLTDEGCVVRRIFGCNDLNGTPKGHVTVNVFATQHRDKPTIGDKYEKYGNVTEYTPENYTTFTYEGKTLENLATEVGMAAADITAYKAAISDATGDAKATALEDWREAISMKKYDVLAVYGGGNLAPYVPTNIDNELTSVTIEGCRLTSIKQVYGGGNAAFVPATSVRINEAYEIDEVFGGGNGKDSYLDPRDNLWYQNPGANVGYTDFTHVTTGSGSTIDDPKLQEDNDDAKDASSRARYKSGSGVATTNVAGGRLHKTYGGSNKRGNISNSVMSVYQESGTCDLIVDYTYGAGKDATTDGQTVMKMDCVQNMENIFGGSTNADVYSDIVLTITNGTYGRVFGGNDRNGAIYGSITVNIEEGGCVPIHIGELYAGGFEAPYSIYGYETNADGSYKRDANGKLIPLKSGTNPTNDPCINVISASSIGNIYGGGYKADVVGTPHINVNMKAGKVEVVNKGTEESPVWKDNEGNGTTYTATDITDETSYYVSDNGLRVDIERVEGTAPDVDGDGTPDDGYTITEGGKTYVYKNGNTFYKVADVNTRTRHWAPLPLGYINNIYGGGNEADIYGDTHVEIGTGKHHNMTTSEEETITPARNAADIRESVYGGGDEGVVTGNTHITLANGTVGDNIFGGGHLGSVGTFTTDEHHRNYSFKDKDGNANGTDDDRNTGVCEVDISGGRVGPETPTADKGNVFGAGMGSDEDYYCEKAMAYATNVSISNGMVTGNVYGGGKIARLENNTTVTIGVEGDESSAPEIKGDVFAAGKGLETHGYSALVRGNPSVTVQGKAKVRGSVYGGGEIASVARYKVDETTGLPVAVENTSSGNCKVVVRDYAEIGPEAGMQMKKFDGSGNPLPPDDKGHVFGAGKGVLPKVYSYADNAHRPKCMLAAGTTLSSEASTSESANEHNIWEYFGNDADYHDFIETLALSSTADVTVGGHAFVKGSVYGGSENGIVQYDTHVTIEGDCQIGNGDGVNRRYTPEEWAEGHLIAQNESETALAATYSASLPECAHWDYDKTKGEPYDPYATTAGVYDYTSDYAVIPAAKRRSSSDHGKPTGTDGHTYYGNVYGGGSGVIPYAPGLWHCTAGIVRRNTTVDITGGHILTSLYGGNEHTDVGTYTTDNNGEFTVPVAETGKCTINMVGGSVGVPRTLEQIAAHPVTCYVFGAGKGDQRIFFNTWTNIRESEVNITGNARIYGSVFGGGEDGHVIENAQTNIGDSATIGTTTYTHPTSITDETPGVIIGLTGTSYVDGNVFGAGRGFSGEALTAGSVGGNVEVNISDGKMLGSVYGGGRLASVGIGFNAHTDSYYGQFTDDDRYTEADAQTGTIPEGKAIGDVKDYSHGHITVNITGGTIGNDNESLATKHTKGGNVFGGSMGRLELLDGTTPNKMWAQLGQVKTAAVNISGGTIKSNVYGGGELGTVRDSTTITISGGTVNRDVYGGGYGSQIFADDYNTTIDAGSDLTLGYNPMRWAGMVGTKTNVTISGGRVKKSVYGGGEMASVGIINYRLGPWRDTEEAAKADGSVVFKNPQTNKFAAYANIVKHTDESNSFALSWPYEFSYFPGYEGKTNVTITGGRIGLIEGSSPEDNPFADDDKDNGDVYGAGKGIAGDYNDYLFCANVGSAEVNINYTTDETTLDPVGYVNGGDCIAGAVYGGGENGHVIGDTKVTLTNGLIGHALYGGGSGKSKFTTDRLLKIGKEPGSENDDDYYTRDIYSITAGKVFGNTTVEMSGGYVVRNIFGGGTLGSVGKGNYASGADDYYPTGYGETLTGNLWTSTYDPDDANSTKDNAWHFLNSGKCSVKITGGTVGYVDPTNASRYVKDGLPYGNVFGGCRGEAAPNIMDTPRYLYCPEFFLGYANETEVIIGDSTRINDADYSGPTILGSVYGGGQDGHVRRDTHVKVCKGEIGMPYGTEVLKDAEGSYITDLDSPQWLHRGNVYGAGSGISKYKYDLNYNNRYTKAEGQDEAVEANVEEVDYRNPSSGRVSTMKEIDHCTSAGSVTRFTQVDVLGGTIHRNVYGGGSLASVGAPPIPPTRTDMPYKKDDTTHGPGWQSQCTVNISATIGTPTDYQSHYGGEVYGAGRGLSAESSLGSVIWTLVNIFHGSNVQGNVFGGGDAGMVKKDAEVIVGDYRIVTPTAPEGGNEGAGDDSGDVGGGSDTP